MISINISNNGIVITELQIHNSTIEQIGILGVLKGSGHTLQHINVPPVVSYENTVQESFETEYTDTVENVVTKRD